MTLNQEFILYWKEYTGETISTETAEEYLHSLAGLYEAFNGLMQPQ